MKTIEILFNGATYSYKLDGQHVHSLTLDAAIDSIRHAVKGPHVITLPASEHNGYSFDDGTLFDSATVDTFVDLAFDGSYFH